MTAANVYQPGDEVNIAITITDNTGTVYDPSTVKFHYTDATGTDYAKTVGVDSVATKTSTGHYQLIVYIPYSLTSVGFWYYDAQALDGSANSLLVSKGSFYVETIRTL